MGNSSSSYTEADSYKDGIVKDEYANDKLFFFGGYGLNFKQNKFLDDYGEFELNLEEYVSIYAIFKTIYRIYFFIFS